MLFMFKFPSKAISNKTLKLGLIEIGYKHPRNICVKITYLQHFEVVFYMAILSLWEL
jgi:hypothetical protein